MAMGSLLRGISSDMSGVSADMMMHGSGKPFLRMAGCELMTDIFTGEVAYWAWCEYSSQFYKIGWPSA